jgi:hypothetical protein
MNRFEESHEDRREREREERHRYESDVFYEVWRSGRDPDRIDFDRVDDHRWDGLSADDSAAIEIRLQAKKYQESEHEDC